VDGSIPAGMIMGYALDVNPPAGASGWLSCQGYSLSTTTYANLFAAIGYTYGGSGANFTIPDFRGCFLRGFDGGRGLDFQGSRAAGTYQASYLTDHNHTVIDPQHSHTIFDPQHTHGAVTGGHSHTVNDPTHVHGGVAVTGSGTFVLGSAGFQIQSGNTSASGTGISINAVGNLGVTVSNALTGVETFDALTGVTVGSVSTGNVNFSETETTVQNYPILWCIKY
jgi:microcystin-dependent protein